MAQLYIAPKLSSSWRFHRYCKGWFRISDAYLHLWDYV